MSQSIIHTKSPVYKLLQYNKNNYFLLVKTHDSLDYKLINLNKHLIKTTSDKLDNKKRSDNIKLNNSDINTNILLNKADSKFSSVFNGLEMCISGRLRGAQRARKMRVNLGRISSQTFNTSLQFNKKQIYTK